MRADVFRPREQVKTAVFHSRDIEERVHRRKKGNERAVLSNNKVDKGEQNEREGSIKEGPETGKRRREKC